MHKTNLSKNVSLTPKKLILSSLLPILIYVILSLVFSALCYFSKDPSKMLSFYSLIALVLSGGISGFINSKIGSGKGVLLAALSAVISSAILLILALIFSDNAVGLKLLMNTVCYIMSTFLFAFLGKQGKRKRFARISRRR